MSYKKGLSKIFETTLASGSTFGPESGTNSSVQSSDKIFAPGDARNIWGQPDQKGKKKRRKKMGGFPLYKRQFAELMNAESVDADKLELDCVVRTQTPDQLEVVKKILEKHSHEYTVADDDMLSFQGIDAVLRFMVEEVSKIIGQESFVAIIAESQEEGDPEEDPDATLQDQIEGGKSDGMSVKEIADKHGVSVEDIENELRMGIEIEHEHTDDRELAEEIAMDHLSEFPNYYTELKKFEERLKKQNGERK